MHSESVYNAKKAPQRCAAEPFSCGAYSLQIESFVRPFPQYLTKQVKEVHSMPPLDVRYNPTTRPKIYYQTTANVVQCEFPMTGEPKAPTTDDSHSTSLWEGDQQLEM